MLTGDAVDTILNLATFAFIGAMVWLSVRRVPDRTEEERWTEDD
ncbi:hypothetical protein [Jannaschia marina]|nr:hypothetical protein [Jannaschia marina]